MTNAIEETNGSTEPTMLELVKIYPERRKVRPQYYKQLCSKIGKFIEYCGNESIRASEVTKQIEYGFLNELAKPRYCERRKEVRQIKRVTLMGYQRALRAVINFAEKWDVPEINWPQHDNTPPKSFTRRELQKLLATAAKLSGVMSNGIPYSVFWETAIHVAYSTGLRRGDMLRLKTSKINKKRYALIEQSKTERDVRVRISKKGMKLIAKHGHKLATPWPYCEKHFGDRFRELCEAAGVRAGLTWKCIRKAAGSHADADGRGHEILGNGRAVFEKHYRDPMIASKKLPKQVSL